MMQFLSFSKFHTLGSIGLSWAKVCPGKYSPVLAFILLFVANTSHGDELSSLLDDLDQLRKQHQVAAYAVVITSPDKVLLAENRGYMSLKSEQAIPEDAYFRVGSITKSFIGLAALIAEQKDLLSLKDSLSQYIGNSYFDNPWQETAPITLEQLLQHSAGLADMSSGQEFNHNSEVSNREGLGIYAKDRKVRWQPGLYYSYSNTGFGLAGLAIENASKQNINLFLQENLFTPLNMSSATLAYTPAVKNKLVPGYDRDGITQLPYWHMIFPAFGALNVQPKDMANFLQLYLNRGQFNDNTLIQTNNMTRAELPSTTLAARNGLDYGYGLGLYNWFRDGHEFFGHGGDGDGYLARYGYSHQAKLAYFVVINRFQHQPLRAMQKRIEEWIVKDLDDVELVERISTTKLERITGTYQSVTSRFSRGRTQELEIFQSENKLFTRINDGRSYQLIPVTNNLYRRRNEPEATIAITEHKNDIIFSGDDGNFIKN